MEFEKNLKDLEDIVEKMSDEKLNLNSALKSFEKGMALVKKCRAEITRAEAKVEKLLKVYEDGRVETEPFDVSGNS